MLSSSLLLYYFQPFLKMLFCDIRQVFPDRITFFEESIEYLIYNFSKSHVHLLHHLPLLKISLNSFNLNFNDLNKKYWVLWGTKKALVPLKKNTVQI